MEQNESAKREIEKSSEDNFAAIAGNTAPPLKMPVPQPFAMVSVGARNKASLNATATTHHDTPMETDTLTATEVLAKPVPGPTVAKAKVINVPAMVEEGGLTIWSNMMLKGHPDGFATNWEQWTNSFSGQLK